LISGVFVYLTADLDVFSSPGSSPGILTGTLLFFTLSAMLWAPLYTWMVIVMLFWGRGKTDREIRTLYLLVPVLLACAMGFPALLVDLPGTVLFLLWGILRANHLDFFTPVLLEYYSIDQALSVSAAWAFMAALCIVIGYTFVGCALLVERVIQRRGLFQEEDPPGEIRPLS
jgi:hypothetical protein